MYQIQNRLCSLSENARADIEMLLLPYSNRINNSLIVNALQTKAAIVVNNSLKEGFGIANLEALWKGKLTVCSNVCGYRQQVTSGFNGVIVEDPSRPESVLEGLVQMINKSEEEKEEMSHNAISRIK